MPLMILGLFFAVGIWAYYMVGKQAEKSGSSAPDEDLQTDDNVIFLPNDLEKMKEKHRNKKS